MLVVRAQCLRVYGERDLAKLLPYFYYIWPRGTLQCFSSNKMGTATERDFWPSQGLNQSSNSDPLCILCPECPPRMFLWLQAKLAQIAMVTIFPAPSYNHICPMAYTHFKFKFLSLTHKINRHKNTTQMDQIEPLSKSKT